jgi:hypothetical protein
MKRRRAADLYMTTAISLANETWNFRKAHAQTYMQQPQMADSFYTQAAFTETLESYLKIARNTIYCYTNKQQLRVSFEKARSPHSQEKATTAELKLEA